MLQIEFWFDKITCVFGEYESFQQSCVGAANKPGDSSPSPSDRLPFAKILCLKKLLGSH